MAVVILVAVTEWVAACGGSGGDHPAGSRRSAPKADPAAAVVLVQATYRSPQRQKTGTGFVYDAKQGLVITSDHAVEASPAITVTDRDGRIMHGRLMARAQCHDFAVIELHPVPSKLTALTLGDSDAVANGAEVRALSYALPAATSTAAPKLVSTHGTVAATDVTAVLHSILPAFGPLIAHQVPLNAQGSGSPLLDDQGRVIGVNTLVGYKHGKGAVPRLNYALSSDFVYSMLRELRTRDTGSLAGWQEEHRCHRAMAKIAGVPLANHGDGMRIGMGEVHD